MALVFSAQTTLSANGVNVISLSATDAAIAFNPVTPLNGAFVSVTLNGSVFSIDTAYVGSQLAVLKVPLASNTFTLFTLLTGGASVAPLSATVGLRLWTDENRRMHWLGYY